MMVERNDGVCAIATKARHPWLYWFTGEIEWIECVVDSGATMRMHCDASSQLKCTMRVFQPDALHFKISRETEYILHFQHDDDTYVYKYGIDVHAVRYVSERRCPSTEATDFKQLFFRTQLKQGNSVHDGIEIVNLGSHILSSESEWWGHFVPPEPISLDSECSQDDETEQETSVPVVQTFDSENEGTDEPVVGSEYDGPAVPVVKTFDSEYDGPDVPVVETFDSVKS